jgi:phosphatidylglycerol---prolipoprotein diacylglyceryl transferase
MHPELFRIGGFFLPTYGLLVALAFLAALAITARLARRSGLDADAILNLGIYCALAGIAGAKLMMFLLDLPYYFRNPSQIFSTATLQAGGVFYGGLLLALLVAVWYMRSRKLPLLATADAFAPGLALGHSIGRIGCFTAGCCWGQPTHLPWAVTFHSPRASELVGVPLGIALHPTQLYEAIAEALIFVFLYRRFGKAHRPGAIIGWYLMLYSTVRFLVEFLRAHDQVNPFGGPFSASQWIALGLIALTAVVWLRTRSDARQPVAARNR